MIEWIDNYLRHLDEISQDLHGHPISIETRMHVRANLTKAWTEAERLLMRENPNA